MMLKINENQTPLHVSPLGLLGRKMYTPARTVPLDPYPYWHIGGHYSDNYFLV